MPISVLHLIGSAVDEFHAELSRLYAGAALEALADPDRYDVHLAYVSPDGSWRFPADLGADALASAPAMTLSEAVAHLDRLRPQVVVPQMFCLPGMTAYRALFDVLGIAYLGNTPEVMAIAADKAKARAIVAAAGVSVPAGEVLRAGDWSSLSLPVVVKPVDADNSVGVSLVRDPGEYDAAVELAMVHGGAALVESYVELGREVRCGIIVRDGELVCLPLEEYAVDSATKPIRGRDDKLDRTGDGELYLVAKDASRAWIVPEDDPITAVVWEAAKRCHVALGCRHYSLFDFRIDPEGKPWFLEAGPYCSFAPTSVVAVMAAAAGVSVRDLFADALAELEVGAAPCFSTTH
ncbi:D-alanine--D-alanine ligase [Mycolicibacterium sp.]|uniref:D-alanine--D-alanine ligase family protein n=1 Tax=Mycolicibacterium sp. TaxID=2320850 RepID=UPI001A1BD4AC|nr:D-alanine--D-alanine ligase [Mycolicibacterium sp.]MBJ7336898.1 D-alanine--D-alanine ligase [Mycolicibacterium sp.]